MISMPTRHRPLNRQFTAKVRVSYVIDNLSRAGTETQLLALIRTLDRDHFEPTLVLLNGDNALSKELEPKNCPVLRLGLRKLFGRDSLSSATRLWKFWRTHQPDVAQFYFLDSAYFGIPIAKLAGIPKILRVRNNLGYWHTRKHRILGRMVQPFVHATLTNSDAGRSALVEKDQQDSHKVKVIENGVDTDRFTPALGVCGRVVCVANLRPVKNVDGLILAMRLICNEIPHATLHVAGEGEERAKLEQLRHELKLEDQVTFAGSVSHIPNFLQAATVAVLPSHSEGMSNALLEAMAAGKAIVATDVGANRLVLGDTGILVPAGDIDALALAVVELLRNPVRAEMLGALARKRVEATFSREAMRERFESFYNQCLNKKPIPARVGETLAGAA